MARAMGIGVDLGTPKKSVRTLQTTLHEKAKAEPGFRFYSLWDKISRSDVLATAFAQCRRNGGSAGVDGMKLNDIESYGRERWLGNLREELRTGCYRPQPLLRMWIPKSNGGRRPLGIPTIRDRVVQTAVKVVLEPIFESDLLPEQYAYRPGLDAKMAVRRVFFHLTQHGRREVVDADLSDYFGSVPHGPLMKCVARRVSDGRLLSLIKSWLKAPVVEREDGKERWTTEAKNRCRGTPQGGVISPLLGNLYFRRFLLAWREFGKTRVGIVNYADDLVLCCRPGDGPAAMAEMRSFMLTLGLTVNEEKTSVVQLPGTGFTFLGYTFERYFTRKGKAYIGTRPSKAAMKRVRRRIHEETSTRWLFTPAQKRVKELNQILRGWAGYFDQGPVFREYRMIADYTERRLQRWLAKKNKRRGRGYRQYPREYLYGELGLFKLQVRDPSSPSAKS